jgi:hypothetical protein
MRRAQTLGFSFTLYPNNICYSLHYEVKIIHTKLLLKFNIFLRVRIDIYHIDKSILHFVD